MKLLTICLSTILFISCSRVQLPVKDDEERCVISLTHSKCRCHQYRISEELVGRVSDSVDHPIEYCDRLVGFKPTAWINFVLWFEEAFQAVRDADSRAEKPEMLDETDEELQSLL